MDYIKVSKVMVLSHIVMDYIIYSTVDMEYNKVSIVMILTHIVMYPHQG
jgi:hypothetical protein